VYRIISSLPPSDKVVPSHTHALPSLRRERCRKQKLLTYYALGHPVLEVAHVCGRRGPSEKKMSPKYTVLGKGCLAMADSR
jgi:hypothetical protein